ncbi:MAG: hypothetical protein LBC19_01595 [Tannerella sp.]|jgi:hypothetical protein|nr:hypothetical protein [Tannerella sp.]
MKKIILFAAMLLLFVDCRTYRAFPVFSLDRVTINNNVQTQAISGNTFENEQFSISISANYNFLSLMVDNKTAMNQYLVWDESSLVDIKGVSQKIVPGGIRRRDAERSTVPTPIPERSKINVSVYRSDEIPFLPKTGRKGKLVNYYNKEIGNKMKLHLLFRTSEGERTTCVCELKLDNIRPR